MTAYYNELDAYPAQWLRNLMAAGHITAGVVDERSITDVQATELRGVGRCHLFAGVGVWDYALRLAGWPADADVWTGSCPCQPYSVAGKGLGAADPRNLWPEMRRLVAECRPSVVLGEQVASRDGRAWLSAVRIDLEKLGYAVGAADTCAAGSGAPHIRQRLYWCAIRLADSDTTGRSELGRGGLLNRERPALGHDADGCGEVRRLGHADSERAGRDCGAAPREEGGGGLRPVGDGAGASGAACGLGDAGDARPQGRLERGDGTDERASRAAGLVDWRDVEWLPCADGKTRPTQPGLRPLAHGPARRVGQLRAYGNGLCAPQAAAWVRAVMGALAQGSEGE